MFYPFKPPASRHASHQGFSKPLEKISSILRRRTNQFSSRASKLPIKKLKVLLILAGLLACCAAAAILYQGLSPKKLTIHRFELSLPGLKHSISVPQSPFRQHALDHYLDSLERALIIDSLKNAKPTSHDSSSLH